MTNKKDNKLRNIERMDYTYEGKAPSFGWWVRFKRKDKKISQAFYDSKFGSEEKALEAAILFRDAIEAELEIGKIARGIGGEQSKSGIIGVARVKSTSKKAYGTYTYYLWQAKWIENPRKQVSRKFSVTKYGEEEALRLAIETRQKAMERNKAIIDPLFVAPNNENAKIWRYMDFTKFVSILENKGLFFARADNLGDPFEGSFSAVNKKLRPLIIKHADHLPDKSRNEDLVKKLRQWVQISCWHVSDYESAGMWNLYAKTEEAVCIQSTYGRLKNCLPNNVKIGLVRYVDYLSEWIPESNLLAPFIYKRKSFEHEKELRAVLNLSGIDNSDLSFSDIEGDPPNGGKWVSLDISKLIEKVYVAPYAPKWFGDLVENVVKTYNISKPVVKSSLDDEPIF